MEKLFRADLYFSGSNKNTLNAISKAGTVNTEVTNLSLTPSDRSNIGQRVIQRMFFPGNYFLFYFAIGPNAEHKGLDLNEVI